MKCGLLKNVSLTTRIYLSSKITKWKYSYTGTESLSQIYLLVTSQLVKKRNGKILLRRNIKIVQPEELLYFDTQNCVLTDVTFNVW
jgi:hypothetical protein